MPSEVWDLAVNPSRSLVGSVATLIDVPHSSGRSGHWEFTVDEARHSRLSQERHTASLLRTYTPHIQYASIDLTGTGVGFAFHVVEAVAAFALAGLAARIARPSLALTFDMPIVAMDLPRPPRMSTPSFLELSAAQQRALREHFEALQPLSEEALEQRRQHLREAESFFREV